MAGAGILEGKKIIIVDDEPDILETLEELLDMCLIDKAPNFETARIFIEKNFYDAAILDIMGVRGYELLQITSEKNIPTLMLTAHALTPDNLVKSIKEGAQSYVPKDRIADIPFFIKDILEARQKGIQKHGGWFTTLRPLFDKIFGPEWQEKDKDFWKEFDETYDTQVSKEELEEIL
ncbi:response regulator [Thermodesulfobacteriota bacterium]